MQDKATPTFDDHAPNNDKPLQIKIASLPVYHNFSSGYRK